MILARPEEIWALDFTVAQIFVVPSPLSGGPPLGQLRAHLAPLGRVRIFPLSRTQLEVQFTPGAAEQPLLALAAIVRRDAGGLERAIFSALALVDEIVIGCDGRGDEATREVARAFADQVHVFEAADIGLSPEEWAADKIHFANARNLGRALVAAPWTLVIDSDEFISACGSDLRALVAAADPEVSAFNVAMGTDEFEHRDPQRLARTRFRYRGQSHNQLPMDGQFGEADMFITHDITLRHPEESLRRAQQRRHGIESLVDSAGQGDLAALFHLAKHKIGEGDIDGVALVEDYRLRTGIHGYLAPERVWLAIACAAFFHQRGDLLRAEQWACRALLDGPRVEAFCILGEIAEDEGELQRARDWFEAACSILPQADKFTITREFDNRFERRDALRAKLTSAGTPTNGEAAAAAAP